MKREPSIHITRTKLIEILDTIIEPGLPVSLKSEWLADYLLKKASNYSLNHRAVLMTNDKFKRDIDRMVKSSQGDAKMLNELIYHIRRNKLKAYGASKVKQSNTAQWTQLKELSSKCINFCNDFELKKKQGFIRYLEIGLPKISSPRNLISKLVNMYESICMIHESMLIIENDDKSKLTREIHAYYVGKIESQTGVYNSFISDPIIYKCFVGVRHIIDKYNVPYKIYIDAQFVGLSFTDSIATPYQLISEKAIERLNSYLYKNKLKIDNGDEKVSLKGVDILKKIKDDNYRDK